MTPIDPNKLLENVTDIMMIDLLHYSSVVNASDLKYILNEPVKGVYICNSPDPVLLEGERYLTRSTYDEHMVYRHPLDTTHVRTGIPFGFIDIYDLSRVKEDIVNENGDTVLSYRNLISIRKMLRQQPIVNNNTIELVVMVALSCLRDACKYSRIVRINDVRNLIKNEYVDKGEVIDYISDVLDDLENKINEFIGNDTWHIYMHRIQNNMMIIEKVIDYRIYQYHVLDYANYTKLNN
jgi:hypothetical protein